MDKRCFNLQLRVSGSSDHFSGINWRGNDPVRLRP